MGERRPDSTDGEERLRRRFAARGQDHAFRFVEDLDGDARRVFLDTLASVDLALGEQLRGILARGEGLEPTARIEPFPYVPLDDPRAAAARRAGEEALAAGRVGAFLAAGGQGVRLGFDGPKGTYPIGPVTDRSLFQVFAETLAARGRRHGRPVPLAVMTSPENHEATRAFFEARGHFGLAAENVGFFPQRMLPAFSPEGKILLQGPGALFLSPDGHGGALRVLTRGGALEWFRERGADLLYYFQVDNPLLPVLDPPFLGYHLLEGSQFTTKVVRKTGPGERMGVFARVDGVLRVVEYIHLPEALAAERDAAGRLVFWAGNVAVHVLSLDLVERFRDGVSLPFHAARKPARILDPLSPSPDPVDGEAVKLETFIFDAIPMADKALVVEVSREDEFAPVKASEGADTPDTARRRLTRKAARWLEGAGARIERDAAGDPIHAIEISPHTALEPGDLVGRIEAGFAPLGPTAL